jgi:hypothetical protein
MNLTTTQLYSSIDLILLIEQIERLTNILVGFYFCSEKKTKFVF